MTTKNGSFSIIFLGPPGSGKGTQSELLANDLKIPNISTGEMLRMEVVNNSEIGSIANRYMQAGGLVPDEVVVSIIKKRISEPDCNEGFILDGFPRNIHQARILSAMLDELGKKIDLVVDIDVDEGVLIKRIAGRFMCKECRVLYNSFFNPTKVSKICDKCGGNIFESRADDNEETVRNRLLIYNQNNKELVDFYRKKGLIYFVDGLKDVALLNLEINQRVNVMLNF